MGTRIKVDKIYPNKTSTGGKTYTKVFTRLGDYMIWGANAKLNEVHQGDIIEIDGITKDDMYQGKQQYKFTKLIAVTPNASSTVSNPIQPKGRQVEQNTEPNPRQGPPIPPLPSCLTTEQVQAAMTEALEIIDNSGVTLKPELLSSVFNGLMQKQAQEFSIALTKRIEATKQANIDSVRRG